MHLHVTVKVAVYSLVHFSEESLQAYVRRLKSSVEFSVTTRECNFLENRNLGCPKLFEDMILEVLVANAGMRSIKLFVQSRKKSLVTVTDNNDVVVVELASVKQPGALCNLLPGFFALIVNTPFLEDRDHMAVSIKTREAIQCASFAVRCICIEHIRRLFSMEKGGVGVM